MAADSATTGHRHVVRWRWVWLTALTAFVVWHTVFDVTIDRGMRGYVDARARYVRGEGPEVTIRGSMADARRRGARLGLVGAGVVVLVGAGIAYRTLPE